MAAVRIGSNAEDRTNSTTATFDRSLPAWPAKIGLPRTPASVGSCTPELATATAANWIGSIRTAVSTMTVRGASLRISTAPSRMSAIVIGRSGTGTRGGTGGPGGAHAAPSTALAVLGVLVAAVALVLVVGAAEYPAAPIWAPAGPVGTAVPGVHPGERMTSGGVCRSDCGWATVEPGGAHPIVAPRRARAPARAPASSERGFGSMPTS